MQEYHLFFFFFFVSSLWCFLIIRVRCVFFFFVFFFKMYSDFTHTQGWSANLTMSNCSLYCGSCAQTLLYQNKEKQNNESWIFIHDCCYNSNNNSNCTLPQVGNETRIVGQFTLCPQRQERDTQSELTHSDTQSVTHSFTQSVTHRDTQNNLANVSTVSSNEMSFPSSPFSENSAHSDITFQVVDSISWNGQTTYIAYVEFSGTLIVKVDVSQLSEGTTIALLTFNTMRGNFSEVRVETDTCIVSGRPEINKCTLYYNVNFVSCTSTTVASHIGLTFCA